MARPFALTLPWLLAACAAAHAPRPGVQRCREVDTQLYGEARPRVEATMQHLPMLELHETHFVRDGIECSVAGLYPLRWAFDYDYSLYIDAPGTYSVFRVSRLDLAGNPAEFVEQYELGPARIGATVEREAGAADRRTLVSRHGGELRLLMLRWHPGSPHYLRCEARLRGAHEPYLATFETMCAEIRVLAWEAR